MGSCTRAILFYGYLQNTQKENWDWACERQNGDEQWDEETGEPLEECDFGTVQSLLHVRGIEDLGYYEQLYLTIEEPYWYGRDEVIDPSLLVVQPEWKEHLQAYMDAVGLKLTIPREPAWHLVSYWG